MANVSFSLEGIDQLRRMQQALAPEALDKAVKQAMAYASKSVKPAAGKAIAERYSIGSKRAQEDIGNPYMSGLAEARISFGRRRPPTAMQFKPRQLKPSGISYKLYKGNSVEVAGGFFQSIRGRRMAVYAKPGSTYKADLSSGRLKPRRGLDVIHGPSVGSIVLRKGKHADEIQAAMRARLLEQFGKGLDRAMRARSRGHGG